MTTTTQPQPRRTRGRPRIPGAEEKILNAALEEYGEHGWSGFTMDAVARRAGVGKSTVYLRWPDKDSLLTEAVRLEGRILADVDTGSLRGDLSQLAGNLLRHFRDPQGWASLRVTFDTASSSTPLGAFAEEVENVHFKLIEAIFDRAEKRGEITLRVPVGVTAELIYGPVVIHALTARLAGNRPTDEEIIERVDHLVSVVLDGIVDRS